MSIPTRVLTTAVAGVFFVGAAWAGNMEARFGNTVVAKDPDGTVTKVFYDKPDTFTATIERPGKPVAKAKGKWHADAKKICVTSDVAFGPFDANREGCVLLRGDKVGDKWQVPDKDDAAKMTDVSIVAGR
jgi:hypothetical protein